MSPNPRTDRRRFVGGGLLATAAWLGRRAFAATQPPDHSHHHESPPPGASPPVPAEPTVVPAPAARPAGAVIETHELVPYSALGRSQSLTLKYDSQRAESRPIITFGYDDLQQQLADLAAMSPGDVLLAARLRLQSADSELTVPGYNGGGSVPAFRSNLHFWTIPNDSTINEIVAALQADMRDMPSGLYTYSLEAGLIDTTSPDSEHRKPSWYIPSTTSWCPIR